MSNQQTGYAMQWQIFHAGKKRTETRNYLVIYFLLLFIFVTSTTVELSPLLCACAYVCFLFIQNYFYFCTWQASRIFCRFFAFLWTTWPKYPGDTGANSSEVVFRKFKFVVYGSTNQNAETVFSCNFNKKKLDQSNLNDFYQSGQIHEYGPIKFVIWSTATVSWPMKIDSWNTMAEISIGGVPEVRLCVRVSALIASHPRQIGLW